LQKICILLALVSSSSLAAAPLWWLARRKRNLAKYRERQAFYGDLYRFTATVCTSFALYLLTVHQFPAPDLPAALLLFLTTTLPVCLLASLSGRWYLGYGAALLVQGFSLHHLAGTLHGDWRQLLLWNAGFDLSGLLLYSMMRRMAHSMQTRDIHEHSPLTWSRRRASEKQATPV
jgi:hypothetical protein